MSGDMPRLWWSPSKAAEFPGGVMAGVIWQYVSGEGYSKPLNLPADAVELVPVSDAPAAPVETELRYIARHMEGKSDRVWEVVDLLGGGKYPDDCLFATAEEGARQIAEEYASKLNAGCCRECGTPGVHWRPTGV